jgi:hypothetical protein
MGVVMASELNHVSKPSKTGQEEYETQMRQATQDPPSKPMKHQRSRGIILLGCHHEVRFLADRLECLYQPIHRDDVRVPAIILGRETAYLATAAGSACLRTRHRCARCGTDPLIGSISSSGMRRLAFAPAGPKGS